MTNILDLLLKAGAKSKGSAQVMTGNGLVDISWDHTTNHVRRQSREEPPVKVGKSTVLTVRTKEQLRAAIEQKFGGLKIGMKKLGLSHSVAYSKSKMSGKIAQQLLVGKIQVHEDLISERYPLDTPETKGILKAEF